MKGALGCCLLLSSVCGFSSSRGPPGPPVMLRDIRQEEDTTQLLRKKVCSRDAWLRGATFGALGLGIAVARPGIGEARQAPLGVTQGLLADCPNEKSCASSQDDRPGCWQEPWSYECTPEQAMAKIKNYVSQMPGAEILTTTDRYLRAEIRTKNAVDETEFFITPNDTTVQFRSARTDGVSDGGANLKRMETIRKALRFDKLPVLRNRRRVLLFVESPWDTFGPTYTPDAPIPEDLDRDLVFGDTDPQAPLWEAPPPYTRSSTSKE